MTTPIELLGMYLHLARASQARKRPHVTDRLMILAGVAAARLKMPATAACCRTRVLEHNSHHMIRRWETFSQALEDSDFLHLLRQLQRRYPLERVEHLLDSLGLQIARERDAYFSDQEYAAALLGLDASELDGDSPRES